MTLFPHAVPRLALALMLALAAPAPAFAQSMSNSFAGFSSGSNAPIDIESDTLEVQDQKKIAIFRGNVKAVQGGTTVRSKELVVHYEGSGGALGANTQITTIRAQGKVLINTANDQTATSDWADFNVKAQTVVIGGNVVLTQEGNVIKGDRLVIDLKSGESRFENTGDVALGKRPRVKGLFHRQQPEGGDMQKQPGN